MSAEPSYGHPGSGQRQEGALGPYLRAIRGRRWLVVAITLLALGSAAFWVTQRALSYQAAAQILISPLAQGDANFLGLSVVRESNDETRTAQTAATLVDSPAAAELAAARLDHGYTRLSIQQAISVQPLGQSNVLSVLAKAGTARGAVDLANTFAHASLEARHRELARQVAGLIPRLQGQTSAAARDRLAQLLQVSRTGDPTLSFSQPAIPPTSPSETPKWVILLLATVAGFTLASLAALLMEAVDQRIRDPEELIRLYPLPVLARVPKLSRRQRRVKADQQPTMSPGVREAFRSLYVQLDYMQLEAQRGHRTIMFTSASSGDGKTTSAFNFALALVTAGNRVILMDFDLRKPDLGRLAGVSASRGLVSLLGGGRTLSDVLVPSPRLPPLSVAPAGTGEGDVLLLGALARRLPAILSEARELADYVVIDTPPLGEVSDALHVTGDVDDIVVIARPGNTTRSSFELMRDLLERGGHTPVGMVIVGAPTRGQSSYYAYGGAGAARASSARFPLARSSAR